ncbi:MAG TPA: hypothetical protein VI386_30815, partial [Candidatus Sulfotelmatobacter sp.]
TLCDCQILEYTTSEPQNHEILFIVVPRPLVLEHLLSRPYILCEVGNEDRSRFHKTSMAMSKCSRLIFGGLDGLNVGPIRAFVFDSCLSEGLDGTAQDGERAIPGHRETVT